MTSPSKSKDAGTLPAEDVVEKIECKKCRGWGALGMGGRDGTCPDCGGAGEIAAPAPATAGSGKEAEAEVISNLEKWADAFERNPFLANNEFIVADIRAAIAVLKSAPSSRDAGLEEAAKKFVAWALENGPWSGLDLEGAEIQEKALALGLIEATAYDPEVHGESNFDVEPGDTWYVLTKPKSPAVPDRNDTEMGRVSLSALRIAERSLTDRCAEDYYVEDSNALEEIRSALKDKSLNPAPSEFDLSVMRERDALRSDTEALVKALEKIVQWSKAYPLSVFP